MKRKLALMIVLLGVTLAACSGSDVPAKETGEIQSGVIESTTPEKDLAPTEEIADESVELSKVDMFIMGFNEVAITPITDAIEIDVTDRESGHYRTEFRLSAFSDSYAKTGKIGDAEIDIVSYGRGNENIRIYADGIDFDKAKEIIQLASPILDDNLSDENIQKVLSDLDRKKEANGYYYGNIGLVLLGNSKGLYDLMLKAE